MNLLRRAGIFVIVFSCLTFSGFGQAKILVTYHSTTGNTKEMAEAVARGVQQVEGAELIFKNVENTTLLDLIDADAIIVGSPVINANMAPEVSEFISQWPFEGQPLKDKIGAAFVTAGGISAGEELTQVSILKAMMIFGMIVAGGDDWTAPFGASAIVSEPPYSELENLDESFLLKGEGLGKRVAQLALRLKD